MIAVSTRLTVLGAAVLAVSLISGAPAASARAPAGVLHVAPAQVQVGSTATLSGSQLTPDRYFTLVLALPNATHAEVRAFIRPAVRADGHGKLNARIRIPRMLMCGPAELVAFVPPKGMTVKTPLRLTGCKRSKGSPPPPPPPKP